MERLTKRIENGTAVYNTPSGDPVKWENNRHKVLQKLAEYEDLGEQGKMLILPCAVGDILYEPRPERGIITEYTVTGFSYCGNTIFAHWRLNSGIYNHLDGVTVNNIGMSVFTTREEAETVLKELYTSKKYKEVRENE